MKIETYNQALSLMDSFAENTHHESSEHELEYTLPPVTKEVYDEIILKHDLEEFVFTNISSLKANNPKDVLIKYKGVKFIISYDKP